MKVNNGTDILIRLVEIADIPFIQFEIGMNPVFLEYVAS